MTVNVSIGNKTSTKVTVGTSTPINTNIISKKTVTLDALSDVNTDDLQDGWTLAYNETTRKWEAVNPAQDLNFGIIDGGSY